MKQAIAAREEKAELAPTVARSEATALIEMLERAARDPAVDVEKMRELMAMRAQIMAEQRSIEWDDAMAAAQSEMRPVAADASNPSTKSRYASYLALNSAMRPVYARHGFSLGFNTAEGAPEGSIRVVCDVSRAGHTRRYQVDMPTDGKGSRGGDVMTKTHATGSGLTYGQRYLLKLIFNIAVGLDDDGNAAGATEPITPEQLAELIKLADEIGADKIKFCEVMKVESLAAIPKAKFANAYALLVSKRAHESTVANLKKAAKK